MLKVKVKYFTTLCELAGRTEEELMMNDCSTLIDLIKIIASKYGREAYDYIYEKRTGKVDPSIYFLINGKDSRILSGLHTKLKNSDVIAIIPPSAEENSETTKNVSLILF